MKLEAQRQTIKHYWPNGTRSAKRIHKISNILFRVISKKLREASTVEAQAKKQRLHRRFPTIYAVVTSFQPIGHPRPDINPIENMWQIMKNNVEKRIPRNTDELMRFMIEE